jgi:hypothetical protein
MKQHTRSVSGSLVIYGTNIKTIYRHTSHEYTYNK